MNQVSGTSLRLIWAFWAAAGLAAVGGVLPILLGGTSSRVGGVLIPFWAAAIAFGACAVLYNQGRTITSILFFIAGLAIVFGLLSMFSLPLRLAVLGTCPNPPAPCPTGLARQLTDAENTGIAAASAFGIVAVLVGFFGLNTLFRRTTLPPATPPSRSIPPMTTPAPAPPPPPPPPPTPAPEAAAPEAESEPEPELPAHEEEEMPELPSHEPSPPTP